MEAAQYHKRHVSKMNQTRKEQESQREVNLVLKEHTKKKQPRPKCPAYETHG